jgi:hypothetical protein
MEAHMVAILASYNIMAEMEFMVVRRKVSRFPPRESSADDE